MVALLVWRQAALCAAPRVSASLVDGSTRSKGFQREGLPRLSRCRRRWRACPPKRREKCRARREGGSNSVVESQPSKLLVAGSIPVSRSNIVYRPGGFAPPAPPAPSLAGARCPAPLRRARLAAREKSEGGTGDGGFSPPPSLAGADGPSPWLTARGGRLPDGFESDVLAVMGQSAENAPRRPM